MHEQRHFLDLDQVAAAELRRIIDLGHALKAGRQAGGTSAGPLAGRTLAMLFERPSTRTRVSFELAARQLGSEVVLLDQTTTHLGRGESVADTARVLSRYADVIMLRAAAHGTLLEMAAHACVPVINGLTDRSHPCQLMADVMTIEERLGSVAGRVVAWSGDGNNVAASMIHAAARFGFELRLACPAELAPSAAALDWAARAGGRVSVSTDPAAAVSGADCVVTDTWVSMGDENQAARRRALLEPFRVDGALMARAAPHAIFMHCLPAHRGDEVTDEVLDGPQSAVWDEAENRLHVQKAILSWCLSGRATAPPAQDPEPSRGC